MNQEKFSKLSLQEIRELALYRQIFLASQLGIDYLDRQIRELRDEQRSLTLEMGQAANADKDLRENPHFMQSRTRLQNEIPRRIRDLIDEQAKTYLYNESHLKGEVAFGKSFEAEVIYPTGDEEIDTFTLLGPSDVSANQKKATLQIVSYLSPIGKSAWGAKIKEAREITFNEKERAVVGRIKIRRIF